MLKKIVVLAVSNKPPGRCVAGIEILEDGSFGNWIRPINPDTNNGNGLELSILFNQHRELIKLMDIVSFEVKEKNYSIRYQTENFNIFTKKHPQSTFFHLGRLSVKKLFECLDQNLEWPNNNSSQSKINDRISQKIFRRVKRSLYLIKCPLKVYITNEGKKFYGEFSFNNTSYKLDITCPIFKGEFKSREERTYNFQNVIMCLSIGENYKGSAYKLIASIINLENYSEEKFENFSNPEVESMSEYK